MRYSLVNTETNGTKFERAALKELCIPAAYGRSISGVMARKVFA